MKNDRRYRRKVHSPFFTLHFSFFIAAALLLASCSGDELDGTEPGGRDDKSEIRFEIGFAPQGGAAYAAEMGAGTAGTEVSGGRAAYAALTGAGMAGTEASGCEATQTRVATDNFFNSEWEEGDAIGLYAVNRASGEIKGLSSDPADNYYNNVKLTYSSVGGGVWTPETPLYFDGANVLDFYAYYPYDPAATDPMVIAFNVQTDQSGTTGSKSNYNLSDLLTAKADNSGYGFGKAEFKNTPIPLIFSHALSLVQVEVPVPGKGFGPSENLVVRLRGVKAGATLDLNAASTTPGSGVTVPDAGNEATNITMHRVEQPGDANYTTSYTYRALVPAQEVARGNSLFWFEHEQRQLLRDGALTDKLTMTAGRAERYEIPLAQAIHTVSIPAGTFLMGSSDGTNSSGNPGEPNYTPAEPGRGSNETQHEVTLTQGFYMSKYQVTNAQFAAFLNNMEIKAGEPTINGYRIGEYNGNKFIETSSRNNPLNDKGLHWDDAGNKWIPAPGCENHPLIYVTWYGAAEYARWIGGSLPTEAQWEYACRAGTTTAYSYGSTADGAYMWYSDNSNLQAVDPGTKAVGSLLPNLWGLYDMHGNVYEWCLDQCNFPPDDYGSSSATNPVGTTGNGRVLRGGSWYSDARNCRSASRFSDYPASATDYFGFRVVFVP